MLRDILHDGSLLFISPPLQAKANTKNYRTEQKKPFVDECKNHRNSNPNTTSHFHSFDQLLLMLSK